MGVVVFPTEVIVRGYFWDRHIPRQSITGMTTYPSLEWLDGQAKSRRTPIHSLAYNPKALSPINDEASSQVRRLRQILGIDPKGRRKRRRRR